MSEKRAQKQLVLITFFPFFRKINIEQLTTADGNGEVVLIILDGFDELLDEQRQERSV